MAVVGEALAVEVDHLLDVVDGPEDVVVQESVAVVGGLLGDLGRADGGVPHEGRDAVERAGHRGEVLQRRAELPLPVHAGLAPQAAQQVVVLHRQGDPLADVLAEPGVDRTGVAASHHEIHPPISQVLEVGVLLGEADRVVGGDQGGGGGQQDPLGARGDVRQEGRGRGGHEGRVVMLAGGEEVEADLVGQLRHLDGVLDPLMLAGGLAGGGVAGDVSDGEDSELHGRSFLSLSPERNSTLKLFSPQLSEMRRSSSL